MTFSQIFLTVVLNPDFDHKGLLCMKSEIFIAAKVTS